MTGQIITDVSLVFGRVVFGGVLAFMSLNNLLNLDEVSGYAEAKGVPAPKFAVAGSSAMLLVGGLSVVTGVFPLIGSVLIVAFFIGTTPKMHDFWNVDGEEKQNELNHFLKNVVLLGSSFGFVALSTQDWAYGVGLRLLS